MRFERRREDLFPAHVSMAMLSMEHVPGGRIELVGFFQTTLERFSSVGNLEGCLDRVFWLKDDGSFDSVASLVSAEKN